MPVAQTTNSYVKLSTIDLLDFSLKKTIYFKEEVKRIEYIFLSLKERIFAELLTIMLSGQYYKVFKALFAQLAAYFPMILTEEMPIAM